MSVHKVADAFPIGSETTADAVQQALASAFPLVIIDADDIGDLDFNAAGVSAAVIPEVVVVRNTGLIYGRDPTNTDPHNGVTVLVSNCGKRYTSALTAQAFFNVLDRSDDPPDSPAAGDRYIVGAAPSGDWASNASDLAFWNGAEWIFVGPEIGQRVYVRAIASRGDWQYGESGSWAQAGSVPDQSVGLSQTVWPFGAVAEEETATPPSGSPIPASGALYIVGVNATDDWDDEDGNIAEADGDGGWIFHAAYDGAEIFDAHTGIRKRYDGGSGTWVSAAGVWVGIAQTVTAGASASQTAPSGGTTYTYSDSVAPTSAVRARKDTASVSYQAKAIGTRRLRITYDADATFVHNSGSGLAGSIVIALFRDSEVNAIGWQRVHAVESLITAGNTVFAHIRHEFYVDVANLSSHSYSVAVTSVVAATASQSVDCSALARRTLTVEERG